MENCCVNNLGKYSHNKPIDTFLMAATDGDYEIYLTDAAGSTFQLTQTLSTGDTITFAVGQLNERMTYTFRIIKPDGTAFAVNDCDTFKLQTIINSQIDGCPNLCEDYTDPNGYYS